mmetsp:Transcript_14006/g.29295  ORF Transcript_14006/g.29295 Transcript_14006/m.29295 type:complete len:209 (-) Transcript_14006:32-658(-)
MRHGEPVNEVALLLHILQRVPCLINALPMHHVLQRRRRCVPGVASAGPFRVNNGVVAAPRCQDAPAAVEAPHRSSRHHIGCLWRRGRGIIALRYRRLEINSTAVDHLSLLQALLRRRWGVERDVAETAGAPIRFSHRHTVEDAAVLREVLPELLGVGVPRNAANEQLRWHGSALLETLLETAHLRGCAHSAARESCDALCTQRQAAVQ